MSAKKAPAKAVKQSDLEAEIAALDAENEELLNYVEQLEEDLTTAGSLFLAFRASCASDSSFVVKVRLSDKLTKT